MESTCNTLVSAATGLAPNKARTGRLQSLPLTILYRYEATGHQSLARDNPAYCDLASKR